MVVVVVARGAGSEGASVLRCRLSISASIGQRHNSTIVVVVPGDAAARRRVAAEDKERFESVGGDEEVTQAPGGRSSWEARADETRRGESRPEVPTE